MTDKLTEALRVQAWCAFTPREWIAVTEAARRWASFPTDEDVEAAAIGIYYDDSAEMGLQPKWEAEEHYEQDLYRSQARAALEAVKREGPMVGGYGAIEEHRHPVKRKDR